MADKQPPCVDVSDFSHELQTHIFNCLLNTFTGNSKEHLKFNMSKAELLIFCPTSSPSARLHHLSEWQLHPPKPRNWAQTYMSTRILLFPLHSTSSKLVILDWAIHKLYPKPQVEATIPQLDTPTASSVSWALLPSSFRVAQWQAPEEGWRVAPWRASASSSESSASSHCPSRPMGNNSSLLLLIFGFPWHPV